MPKVQKPSRFFERTFISLLAAALIGLAAPAAAEKFALLVTNDIHGWLVSRPADRRPATGAAASLATLVAREKLPFLLLDAGDWFQGTPIGGVSSGKAVIEFFNLAGYDAAILGNHDFDFGLKALRKLMAEAQFPILGANISAEENAGPDAAAVAGMLRPYMMRTRAGVRIGVMGITTSDMPNLAFPKHIAGLRFEREVDAARRTARELRELGAEVVVALTHIGIERYRTKNYDLAEGDIFLAEQIPEIDIIAGGHTHVEIKTPFVVKRGAGPAAIIQTRGELGSAYRLVVHVDAETRRPVKFSGGTVALNPKRLPADPAMKRLVMRHQAVADKAMGRKIGSASTALTRNAPGESLLSNWTTDTLRRRFKTDIGLVNTFGLRGELPKGPLTVGDVYKVMPFDNAVVVVRMKGSEIRKMVERSLGSDVPRLKYSGLRLRFNPRAPKGRRTVSIKIGGRPLKDGRVYRIATSDYVAIAGRYMKGLKQEGIERQGQLIRDVLISEIRTSSPIRAKLDGRMSPTKKGRTSR